MIKNNKIKVKVSNNTLKHYKKNYKCNIKDIIEINVNDLPKQSTQLIDVVCDVCGSEKQIQYRKYINNKSNKGFYTCSLSCSQEKIKLTKLENHGNPNFCNPDKRKQTCEKKYNNPTYKNPEKRKETNLEKYGVEHVIMNKEIQEKRKETWLEKYGVDHPMKVEKISKEMQEKRKITKIERGLQIPDDKIDNFLIYRRCSDNYLRKIKKNMIKDWDGYDYYDGEYIKNNLNLDSNHKDYPTLDHKISVYYGYNNDIPLDKINCKENLVFTKRCINSSKQTTCS